MKCYYQVGDATWVKGQMRSFSGNQQLLFEPDGGGTTIALSHYEVLFGSERLVVTGMQRRGDLSLIYDSVRIDVWPGWRAPPSKE